jgi:hypothetical protein
LVYGSADPVGYIAGMQSIMGPGRMIMMRVFALHIGG